MGTSISILPIAVVVMVMVVFGIAALIVVMMNKKR